MGRERRNKRKNLDINMNLDLTSMMNLVMVLIPCLLISIAFLKITKIETQLALGHAEPPQGHNPLGLALDLTDAGYTLKANHDLDISALADLARADGHIFIPIVSREVSCGYYLGTWPPPRHLNRFTEACNHPTETKTFRVYDHAKLTQVLYEIKKSHPTERSITITASQEIEFEAIANAMDASRSGSVGDRHIGTLFPTVVLEPCEL